MSTVFYVSICFLKVFLRSIQYTVATSSTSLVVCGSSILKGAKPQPTVQSSPVLVFFQSTQPDFRTLRTHEHLTLIQWIDKQVAVLLKSALSNYSFIRALDCSISFFFPHCLFDITYSMQENEGLYWGKSWYVYNLCSRDWTCCSGHPQSCSRFQGSAEVSPLLLLGAVLCFFIFFIHKWEWKGDFFDIVIIDLFVNK